MGNYVAAQDVWEALINFNLGPSPRVTDAQVEEHIAGVEGQIDGVLVARAYSPVPAVHAGAVAVIREQVRRKVATIVYLELNQPERSPDWVRTWDIDFGEWLNRLRLGQELLPGGEVNPTGDVAFTAINLGLTEVEDT